MSRNTGFPVLDIANAEVSLLSVELSGRLPFAELKLLNFAVIGQAVTSVQG